METDIQLEETKVKVFICREDLPPILVHQLTAIGQEEFRALLRHLELFAEFLPYLKEAEKKMNGEVCQQEMQLRVTLDNLRTAIELTQSQGKTKIVPILREHGG